MTGVTETQWKESVPTFSGLQVERWTGWIVIVDV